MRSKTTEYDYFFLSIVFTAFKSKRISSSEHFVYFVFHVKIVIVMGKNFIHSPLILFRLISRKRAYRIEESTRRGNNTPTHELIRLTTSLSSFLLIRKSTKERLKKLPKLWRKSLIDGEKG